MNIAAFLRARFAERSSRVQLVVLALLVLVVTGAVSFETLSGWASQLVAMVAIAGPLVGLLVPDTNHDVNAAAATDAAVDAALQLATKAAEERAGPEATKLARDVAGVAEKLGL